MLTDEDELHGFGPASDEESGDTPTRSTSPSSCEGNKASLVKRPWTPEEDDALVAAVRKYGACRWSMIATHLSTGRVGKQCRERWNNHLCPEVKKTEWSEEEDRAILEGVAVLGTRWCEIIKVAALAGRTDNAIKNRFYSLQRRMRSRQLSAKPSSPLGKRQLGEDGCELAPGQRERIVAVATELAFATDEQDRDRLIAELTSALQENNGPDDDEASELGNIDSPDALRQLGSLSQDLPLSDLDGGLAGTNAQPMDTPSALRRARPIADIDTHCGSDTAGPPSLPTPASVVLKQEPSPGCSSAGDAAMDTTSNADSDSTIVPLSAGGARVSSPGQLGSPTGTTFSPVGATSGGSPGRFSPGEKENVLSPRRRQEQIAIGASLGGRHAYKALLAPLCIPHGGSFDGLEEASPMKRLRTPSGSVRTSEPSSLSAGRARGMATGTEEPGAKFAPQCSATADAPVKSPMTELLNLSLFNDLFADTPCSPPPTSAPFAPPKAAAQPLAVSVLPPRPTVFAKAVPKPKPETNLSPESPSTPPFPGTATADTTTPNEKTEAAEQLTSSSAPPLSCVPKVTAQRCDSEEPTARLRSRASQRCGTEEPAPPPPPSRCGTEEPAPLVRPRRSTRGAAEVPVSTPTGVC